MLFHLGCCPFALSRCTLICILHKTDGIFFLTVQPTNPTLSGLDGILDTTKEVAFTCTVDRIRPPAKDIYWMIDGVRVNGSISDGTEDPNDKSLSQTNEVSYR